MRSFFRLLKKDSATALTLLCQPNGGGEQSSRYSHPLKLLLKNVRFTQRLTLLILIGQQRRAVRRPFDADDRIVPGNVAFALRGLKVSRFV